jgi:metal-responsive CopG/Arc/MetJ family transcriptional regulator
MVTSKEFFIMITKRVTIAIPADLLNMIDHFSKKRGISRSRYISIVLREKMRNEKEKQLKEAYDRVFSDESVRREQLDTDL